MNEYERLTVAKRVHAEACRGSLKKFLRAGWRILEPETSLLWNWHHDLICEYLTAVKSGQIRRLIINIAPRTTKSIMASVCFPTWWWCDEPHTRFLFGSYSSTLSTTHSVLRRTLIESQWYQESYGNKVKLTSDTNMKTEFANTATGIMKSSGVKAGILGVGADCILFDDPQDPKGSESDAEREATLQAIDLSWSSRLNDKKTGRVVLIMQRLHTNDATAHLLSKNIGYEHVTIPTVAEKKTIIHFPISGKEFTREEGDLLHPMRDGAEQIEQSKKDLGSFGFAGQHQQNPVPREGALIKVSWLSRFYKQLPSGFDMTLMSWDLTFKGGAKNDYVVGQAWGRVGADLYLIDQIRGQWNFTETVAMIRNFKAKHHEIRLILIEEAANGAAVIETLKREIPGIIPVRPTGSKQERVSAITPIMEAGNVVLPDASIASWVSDLIFEATNFPRHTNDDQVDALSMAIARLTERKVLDWSPVSISGPSKWGR